MRRDRRPAVGGVTLTGSVVAFGKLQGIMAVRPLSFFPLNPPPSPNSFPPPSHPPRSERAAQFARQERAQRGHGGGHGPLRRRVADCGRPRRGPRRARLNRRPLLPARLAHDRLRRRRRQYVDRRADTPYCPLFTMFTLPPPPFPRSARGSDPAQLLLRLRFVRGGVRVHARKGPPLAHAVAATPPAHRSHSSQLHAQQRRADRRRRAHRVVGRHPLLHHVPRACRNPTILLCVSSFSCVCLSVATMIRR